MRSQQMHASRFQLAKKFHQRIGFRYRDIIVWPTGNTVANAAVMGFWGPLRYVVVTDGLLNDMSEEQVQGVFGHEVGHIRGHHLWYYGLFMVGLNDTIIPPEHSAELFEKAKEPKALWVVEDEEHVNSIHNERVKEDLLLTIGNVIKSEGSFASDVRYYE